MGKGKIPSPSDVKEVKRAIPSPDQVDLLKKKEDSLEESNNQQEPLLKNGGDKPTYKTEEQVTQSADDMRAVLEKRRQFLKEEGDWLDQKRSYIQDDMMSPMPRKIGDKEYYSSSDFDILEGNTADVIEYNKRAEDYKKAAVQYNHFAVRNGNLKEWELKQKHDIKLQEEIASKPMEQEPFSAVDEQVNWLYGKTKHFYEYMLKPMAAGNLAQWTPQLTPEEVEGISSKAPMPFNILLKEALTGTAKSLQELKANMIDAGITSGKDADITREAYGLVEDFNEIEDPLDLLSFATGAAMEGAFQIPLAYFTGGGSSFAMASGHMYMDAVEQRVNAEMDNGLSYEEALLKVSNSDEINRYKLFLGSAVSAAMDFGGASGIMKGFTREAKKKAIGKIIGDSGTARLVKKRLIEPTLGMGGEVITEVPQELVEAGGTEWALGGSFMEGMQNIGIDEVKNIAAKAAFGASGPTVVKAVGSGKSKAGDLAKAVRGDQRLKNFAFDYMKAEVSNGNLTQSDADAMMLAVDRHRFAFDQIKDHVSEENLDEAVKLQEQYDLLQHKKEGMSEALKPIIKKQEEVIQEKLIALAQRPTVKNDDLSDLNISDEELASIDRDDVEVDDYLSLIDRLISDPEVKTLPALESVFNKLENSKMPEAEKNTLQDLLLDEIIKYENEDQGTVPKTEDAPEVSTEREATSVAVKAEEKAEIDDAAKVTGFGTHNTLGGNITNPDGSVEAVEVLFKDGEPTLISKPDGTSTPMEGSYEVVEVADGEYAVAITLDSDGSKILIHDISVDFVDHQISQMQDEVEVTKEEFDQAIDEVQEEDIPEVSMVDDSERKNKKREEILSRNKNKDGAKTTQEKSANALTAAAVKAAAISPERSKNHANLTEDDDGNFVFYHVTPEDMDETDPSMAGKAKHNATSTEEASAVRKVGGMTMFYTRSEDGEAMVSGKNRYMFKVSKGKVYDFNEDPLSLLEKAEERHSKENKGLAFDKNTQLAYVTKIANELGFDMVVAKWNNKTRAQSTKPMKPSDIEIKDGDTITKKFDNNYESNSAKKLAAEGPVKLKVGDKIKIHGREASITSVDDGKYSYKGDDSSGSFPQKSIDDGKVEVIEEDSKVAGKPKSDSSINASKTKAVKMPNAPIKGTFLDIEMVAGKDGRKLTEKEVIDALPEAPIEVDNDGTNLRIKMPRQLTDAEMKALMEATEQEAIGQVHNQKGILHGQSKELLDSYGGEFNPKYFKLPRVKTTQKKKSTKEEGSDLAEGESKIADRPSMENPVHAVKIGGKVKHLQRSLDNDGNSGWYEVIRNKDGSWDLPNGQVWGTAFPVGYTKAEAISAMSPAKKEPTPKKNRPKEVLGEKIPYNMGVKFFKAEIKELSKLAGKLLGTKFAAINNKLEIALAYGEISADEFTEYKKKAKEIFNDEFLKGLNGGLGGGANLFLIPPLVMKYGISMVRETYLATKDISAAINKGLESIKAQMKAGGLEYNEKVVKEFKDAIKKMVQEGRAKQEDQVKEVTIDYLKDEINNVLASDDLIGNKTKSLIQLAKDLMTALRKSGVSDVPTSKVEALIGKLKKAKTQKTHEKVAIELFDLIDKIKGIDNARKKNALIKKMMSFIKKAKQISKQNGKAKPKSVDPDTQIMFEQMDTYLVAMNNNTTKAIDQYLEDKEDEINEAIAKDTDDMTKSEKEIVGLFYAKAALGGIDGMTYSELADLFNDIKALKSIGIARIKEMRAQSHQRRQSINKKAEGFVKGEYGDILYDEDGNLITESEKLDGKRKNRYVADKDSPIKGRMKRRTKINGVFKEALESIRGAVKRPNLRSLLTLESIANTIDRGSSFIEDNIRRPLNKMFSNKLKGIQDQREKMNGFVDKNFASYSTFSEYMLAEGGIMTTIIRSGNNKPIMLSNLGAARIYALYKDPVQRQKLQKQGFNADAMAQIKESLGVESLSFIDDVVNYLSGEYYESINKVHEQTNYVSLPRVENYFPVKVERMKGEGAAMGQFAKNFNAQTQSALKGRVDTTTDIKIEEDGMNFATELMSHFEDMEHFKSYAQGVKDIDTVMSNPDVSRMLDLNDVKRLMDTIIDLSINEKGHTSNPSLFNVLIKRFTGHALSFKPIQLIKQASSFINAFEDYTFIDGKRVAPLDLPMFAMDYAKTLLTLRSSIKKFKEISPTFKERIDNPNLTVMYNNIMSGPRKKGMSKVEKTANWFTYMGDVLGVLGYAAVYNRNIKNGMSEEQALEQFEEYNVTQQSRRPQDMTDLQIRGNWINRTATAFMSTAFLMFNKTYNSQLDFRRDLAKGKWNSKALRGFFLSLGAANTLFALASNMFKLGLGDEEDKDEVLIELEKAMMGVKMFSAIPIVGSIMEEVVDINVYGRRPWKSGGGLNPLDRAALAYKKAANDDAGAEEFFDAANITQGLLTGLNLAPLKGMYKLIDGSEKMQEDGILDILGISNSYKPSEKDKRRRKSKPPLIKRAMGEGSSDKKKRRGNSI